MVFLAPSPGTSVTITPILLGKLGQVSRHDALMLQAKLEMTLTGGMVMAEPG